MYYVRQSMRTLAQEGKTLILVTHYPEDVIPEIGRIVMIKDGLVFADGPEARAFDKRTHERPVRRAADHTGGGRLLYAVEQILIFPPRGSNPSYAMYEKLP